MQPREWDPVEELDDIQRRLNRLLADRWMPVREHGRGFTPPLDIQESGVDFIVTVDLPAVKRDGLRIHVQDTVVVIEGERSKALEENGTRFYKAEREYGRFVRRFELPVAVECRKIQAEFRDGVLKVVLPKAPVRGRH